jgi:hypothetical protein
VEIQASTVGRKFHPIHVATGVDVDVDLNVDDDGDGDGCPLTRG